jgi:hypothetical protein
MKLWSSLDVTAGIKIAINDIGNAMLLDIGDHMMFRSFMWYLEPVVRVLPSLRPTSSNDRSCKLAGE